MNKFYLLCTSFVLAISFQSFAQKDSNVEVHKSIIPRASYFVFQNDHGLLDDVSFFTFDGELLYTMENDFSLAWGALLDPQAPKPQPVKYRIQYGHCCVEGIPIDDFIDFYDKNGNLIMLFLYNRITQMIDVEESHRVALKDVLGHSSPEFPLDLTMVQEQVSPTRSWKYCSIL